MVGKFPTPDSKNKRSRMECSKMRSPLISAVLGVNMADWRQSVVAEKEVALCFSKLGYQGNISQDRDSGSLPGHAVLGTLTYLKSGSGDINESCDCSNRQCVKMTERGQSAFPSLLPYLRYSLLRSMPEMVQSPGYVCKAAVQCCPNISVRLPFPLTGGFPPPCNFNIKDHFYQVTLCNQNLKIIPTFLLENRSSETQ